MYAKYRPCPSVSGFKKTSVPFCPPVQCQGSAIPESARVIADQCPQAWVTTIAGPTCEADATLTGTGVVTTRRILVPVAPAAPIPIVPVGTIPARLTTQQRATEAIFNANDPYNPSTRFAQYFPPAPLPYICPERIPNNDPKPSTNICLPPQRYQGSASAPQTE